MPFAVKINPITVGDEIIMMMRKNEMTCRDGKRDKIWNFLNYLERN